MLELEDLAFIKVRLLYSKLTSRPTPQLKSPLIGSDQNDWARCLNITEKSLNQHCERSELYFSIYVDKSRVDKSSLKNANCSHF